MEMGYPPRPGLASARLAAATFTITTFVNAALLFAVEPLFSKMALPLLGGTPGVWNTCMLFFQTTLLAGYAYAHVVTTRLSPRTQTVVHLTLLALSLLVLPISIGAGFRSPQPDAPVAWLIAMLSVSPWRAVPDALERRSVVAAVVQSHRPRGRRKPLVSVRGEQSGKHDRAARVSRTHRTHANPVDAEPRVERMLRGAHRTRGRLRGNSAEPECVAGGSTDGSGRRCGTPNDCPTDALGCARVRSVEHAPSGSRFRVRPQPLPRYRRLEAGVSSNPAAAPLSRTSSECFAGAEEGRGRAVGDELPGTGGGRRLESAHPREASGGFPPCNRRSPPVPGSSPNDNPARPAYETAEWSAVGARPPPPAPTNRGSPTAR